MFVVPNITLKLQCLLNNVFIQSGFHKIHFLEKTPFPSTHLCVLKGIHSQFGFVVGWVLLRAGGQLQGDAG